MDRRKAARRDRRCQATRTRSAVLKLRLLEFIRCPACGGRLDLEASVAAADAGHPEVEEGLLRCVPCGLRYPIRDGIPRLIRDVSMSRHAPTARTAVRFGCLWSHSDPDRTRETGPYHFEKMAATLGLEEPRGVVMDAGCGDGIDLAQHAERGGVESIGVELSDGGCLASAARIRGRGTAHVVQADLRSLPFADGTFDRVYSYGVLHHVASPSVAAGELARVSRPGAEIAIYLYEDFAERALAWRLALSLVNSARWLTTRLPPSLLYAMCRVGSPVVYLLFTVPHHVLRLMPGLKALAGSIPFRHGRGPCDLAGDLYDRFSAPIEYRYSRRTAAELLTQAGLTVTEVGYERGWMVAARQVAPQASNAQRVTGELAAP